MKTSIFLLMLVSTLSNLSRFGIKDSVWDFNDQIKEDGAFDILEKIVRSCGNDVGTTICYQIYKNDDCKELVENFLDPTKRTSSSENKDKIKITDNKKKNLKNVKKEVNKLDKKLKKNFNMKDLEKALTSQYPYLFSTTKK